MKEIVLVTTYNRPELLYLCLEHLAACPEIREKEIWVRYESRSLADDYLRENRIVVGHFKELPLRFESCRGHGYSGNSWNVLTAYKDALEAGAERIYLVEDDVLIQPDFFRWHAAMYRRDPRLFCSIGWHCLRRSDVPRGVDDPLGYFTSCEDYASIGVCWPRQSLGYVTELCTSEYFENPVGFLRRRFPKSSLSLSFSEQDGLIMHVLEEVRAPVAWPAMRRCNHVGWWGYHRPSAQRMIVSGAGPGALELRIAEAHRVVRSPKELAAYSGGMYGGDIDPVIPTAEWEEKDLCCRVML